MTTNQWMQFKYQLESTLSRCYHWVFLVVFVTLYLLTFKHVYSRTRSICSVIIGAMATLAIFVCSENHLRPYPTYENFDFQTVLKDTTPDHSASWRRARPFNLLEESAFDKLIDIKPNTKIACVNVN